MKTAYLGIGGNLNDTLELFKQTIVQLENQGIHVTQTSSIYKTKAWGFESQNDFLNAVFEVRVNVEPLELLARINEVESKLGRVRTQSNNYTDRPIDLDILFYGDEVFNSEKLSIPHEKLHLRNFVLVPLNELIPDFYHPKLHQKISELTKKTIDSEMPIKVIKPLVVNT